MKIKIFICFFISFLSGCVNPIAPGFDPPRVPGVEIKPITSGLVHEQELGKLEVAPSSIVSTYRNDYEYRIGPHDVLSIVVWEHPEFNFPASEAEDATASGYLVDKDGTIFFPFAGKVKVAGKTIDEVRQILTRRIRTAILNPQIDVKVVSYRSRKIYVTGEIATPGQQPLTDAPLNLLDAISQAGGPTANADLINVTLARDGKKYNIDLLALYEDGDVHENLLLKDGDVLRIPNKSLRKVYVIGEVRNPSSQLMERRQISLTEAINDAGGINPITSNPAQIYVIRGVPDGMEIYHLNSRTPAALILGDNFPLKSRDIVYVETAAVARWSRLINQILPTVTFFGQPDLINR